MSSRLTQQQKEALIAKWIARWKPRLLLDRWVVIARFAEEDRVVEGENDLLAEISINERYIEARLTIYPKLWDQPRRLQETTIIHELAHILTEPVADLLNRAVAKKLIPLKVKEDTWEALTEDIAKIVAKAYMKGKAKNYHL